MNNFFVNVFKGSTEYLKLNKCIEEDTFPISITGLSGSAISNIIFSLSAVKGNQALVVTYNELEARKIYEDLRFFSGERVLYFPSKEIVFYDVFMCIRVPCRLPRYLICSATSIKNNNIFC